MTMQVGFLVSNEPGAWGFDACLQKRYEISYIQTWRLFSKQP